MSTATANAEPTVTAGVNRHVLDDLDLSLGSAFACADCFTDGA